MYGIDRRIIILELRVKILVLAAIIMIKILGLFIDKQAVLCYRRVHVHFLYPPQIILNFILYYVFYLESVVIDPALFLAEEHGFGEVSVELHFCFLIRVQLLVGATFFKEAGPLRVFSLLQDMRMFFAF